MACWRQVSCFPITSHFWFYLFFWVYGKCTRIWEEWWVPCVTWISSLFLRQRRWLGWHSTRILIRTLDILAETAEAWQPQHPWERKFPIHFETLKVHPGFLFSHIYWFLNSEAFTQASMVQGYWSWVGNWMNYIIRRQKVFTYCLCYR